MPSISHGRWSAQSAVAERACRASFNCLWKLRILNKCYLGLEVHYLRLDSTLQRKPHLCIPFLEIARPQSQFPRTCVWDCGRAIPFAGNMCFEFSVLVLCSIRSQVEGLHKPNSLAYFSIRKICPRREKLNLSFVKAYTVQLDHAGGVQ